jgi:nicotinamidase-related amidase
VDIWNCYADGGMVARLEPRSTLLLLVDIQERLAAAMPGATLERLVKNVGILLDAARILGVHVVATEQYPKGLGRTLAPLAERLSARGVTPIEKLDFSALDDAAASRAIASLQPRAIVVAGMETHVCVFQTARDLAARGFATHVVADAVASRTEENRLAGLTLATRSGALETVTEAVVFDWQRRAEGEAFKSISKLVR